MNGADLAQLLDNWGTVPAGRRDAADFDGNGAVNGGDLSVLLSNWS